MKSMIRNLTTIAVLSGLHLIGWCIYFPKFIASLNDMRYWMSFIIGGIEIGAILLLLLMIWTIQGVWSYCAEWSEMKDFVMKILSMLMIFLPFIFIHINSPSIYFYLGMVLVSVLVIAFDYFEMVKILCRHTLQV